MSRRNSLGASKKQGTSASADSANDAVPGDETVRMPHHFINGTEFGAYMLGLITNLSWRWRRHLIKPSELGLGIYLWFGLS